MYKMHFKVHKFFNGWNKSLRRIRLVNYADKGVNCNLAMTNTTKCKYFLQPHRIVHICHAHDTVSSRESKAKNKSRLWPSWQWNVQTGCDWKKSATWLKTSDRRKMVGRVLRKQRLECSRTRGARSFESRRTIRVATIVEHDRFDRNQRTIARLPTLRLDYFMPRISKLTSWFPLVTWAAIKLRSG